VKTGEHDLSEYMIDWLNQVDKAKAAYIAEHDERPTSITMSRSCYIQLCAATGSVVKSVRGLDIQVRWGENTCSKK